MKLCEFVRGMEEIVQDQYYFGTSSRAEQLLDKITDYVQTHYTRDDLAAWKVSKASVPRELLDLYLPLQAMFVTERNST